MKRGKICSAAKLLTQIALISFMFILAGCARKAPPPDAKESPNTKRIISTAPSITEIISGLGFGNSLIAHDPYSRNIPGVPQGLPMIDFFYPDTEAVIGLEPCIIFTGEINNYGAAGNPFKLLEDFGIKVVQVPTSTSIAGIYNDIAFIAGELDAAGRGEAMIKKIKDEVEIIAARKKESGPSVYFEVSSAPAAVTFGSGTYLNEMIETAGGRNIFSEEKGWFSPAAEEILVRNPEIIFVMSSGGDAAPDIKKRPGFESISAIKENRVYSIDADSASRPSQNIVKALRQIAAAVNP